MTRDPAPAPAHSPAFARYGWNGGEEWIARFGPDDGAVVVVAAPPLFEEANRTRAFTVAILRALADRGIAGVLPDLPGQGDSLAPLAAQTIGSMQVAYRALVAALGAGGRRCYALGIRSGALLDALGPVHGRWHLAPQRGSALMRELTRVKQAEIGPFRRLGERWFHDPDQPDAPVSVAGNLVSPHLLADLSRREPVDVSTSLRRVVRLASDPAPADRHIVGTPIWRRAEPGNDPLLAQQLARDIADWIAACAGR